MKIEFTDEEVASLPEEVRVKVADNTFEGTPFDFIPDVNGLKTTLEKTREEKRSAEKVIKKIAEKFGSDKDNILSAVDGYIDAPELKRKLADSELKHEISAQHGSIFAAPGALKDHGFIQYDETSGQYIVPGENGEPLENEDGSLQSVTDAITKMKNDGRFDALFTHPRLQNSGSGSPPQKAGDGPSSLPVDNDASLAPPTSMRQKDMNAQQRRLAATVGGGLENYRS